VTEELVLARVLDASLDTLAQTRQTSIGLLYYYAEIHRRTTGNGNYRNSVTEAPG